MRGLLEEVIVVGVSEARRSPAVIVLLGRFIGVASVLDPGRVDGVHFGSRVASRSHLLILFLAFSQITNQYRQGGITGMLWNGRERIAGTI